MTITLSTNTSQETPDYSWAPPLVERPIGDARPVRILGVGAGFSGIGFAIQVASKLPNSTIQIYEKADQLGGVWHANRYPGVACDIPAHTYQFTFCENTQWSRFYAPGAEIKDYLDKVADEYDVRPVIKLRHEVIELRWQEEKGAWLARIRDLESGHEFTDEAEFIAYAPGGLSRPQWPAIPGREEYKGIIRHSGTWNIAAEEAAGMDYSGKSVAVIGVGSSAIQIVPSMRERGAKITNFGRTKTWLAGVFADAALKEIGSKTEGSMNHTFTPEEKEKFRDPEFYESFRSFIERDRGSVHEITHRDSPLQKGAREALFARMQAMLASKPEIAATLIPDFPVGCKRLTPGPGYLEALVSDDVSFVNDEIECFTPTGLRAGGKDYDFDVIVCATGFDVSLVPGFPIYGAGGVNLQDTWGEEVQTYLSVMVPKMPNFFQILGAQAGVGSGNLIVLSEAMAKYALQAISKCQTEGYKSITVKDEPVKSFMKYTDDYFARTVFTTNCKSWYKNGQTGAAKIRTLWPGSSQHAFVALRKPRWEDFDFSRAEGFDHTMAWLGNGHISPDLDAAFYYPELRSYHGETQILAN